MFSSLRFFLVVTVFCCCSGFCGLKLLQMFVRQKDHSTHETGLRSEYLDQFDQCVYLTSIITPFYYRSYVSNKAKRGFCDTGENKNHVLKLCFSSYSRLSCLEDRKDSRKLKRIYLFQTIPSHSMFLQILIFKVTF